MSEAGDKEAAGAVVERAMALANPGGPEAVGQLGAAGREALEAARAELVRRIYMRSDDYRATAALSLVNKALVALGWEDPYNWKRRRKP
jgi:hypothetical protein